MGWSGLQADDSILEHNSTTWCSCTAHYNHYELKHLGNGCLTSMRESLILTLWY